MAKNVDLSKNQQFEIKTVSIRRNTRCSSCSFVVPLQAQ